MRCLWHAQRLLTMVLQTPTQSGNVYAASALGVVLARSLHYSEALQIFKHVWELHPEDQFFWENLALAQLHTGHFKRARQTLEAAIAKFGRSNPYLCALSAAAKFKCEDYKACRRELLLQLHAEPFDVTTAFNVAYVAHQALKSSINKIQIDREYRQEHQRREDKLLKPLPVDKQALLQQGSDLESSIALLQAAVSMFPEDKVPKEFVALLEDARIAVSFLGGYCQYMDYVEGDMQDVCREAIKFLEEDKFMKRALEEQEALRITQEMNQLASASDECVFCDRCCKQLHLHSHAAPLSCTSTLMHLHSHAAPLSCRSTLMHLHSHAPPLSCTPRLAAHRE
jgi:tetratricopeptide (TPR) repeat protein